MARSTISSLWTIAFSLATSTTRTLLNSWVLDSISINNAPRQGHSLLPISTMCMLSIWTETWMKCLSSFQAPITSDSRQRPTIALNLITWVRLLFKLPTLLSQNSRLPSFPITPMLQAHLWTICPSWLFLQCLSSLLLSSTFTGTCGTTPTRTTTPTTAARRCFCFWCILWNLWRWVFGCGCCVCRDTVSVSISSSRQFILFCLRPAMIPRDSMLPLEPFSISLSASPFSRSSSWCSTWSTLRIIFWLTGRRRRSWASFRWVETGKRCRCGGRCCWWMSYTRCQWAGSSTLNWFHCCRFSFCQDSIGSISTQWCPTLSRLSLITQLQLVLSSPTSSSLSLYSWLPSSSSVNRYLCSDQTRF